MLKNGSVSQASKLSVYRTKKPLKAITKKPRSEMLMPAGSVFVWRHGNGGSGMVSVSWLNRSVHLKETDLFEHCERVADAPIPLVLDATYDSGSTEKRVPV